MESKKTVFSSQMKKVKDILLQFESVVNELNELHDSNNSGKSIENTIDSTNAHDATLRCPGNQYEEIISPNGICWLNGNQKSITRIQSIATKPFSVTESSYSRNKTSYSNVSQDKISFESNPKSSRGDEFICYNNRRPNKAGFLPESNPKSGWRRALSCDRSSCPNEPHFSSESNPKSHYVGTNTKSYNGSVLSCDRGSCPNEPHFSSESNLKSHYVGTLSNDRSGRPNEFEILRESNTKSYSGSVLSCDRSSCPNEPHFSSESNPKSHYVGTLSYDRNGRPNECMPESNPKSSFDGAGEVICDGNGCSKRDVMGVEIPIAYGFDEKKLECVLEEASSKNIVNYFYYFRDVYDEDYRMDIDNVGRSTTPGIPNPTPHEDYRIASSIEDGTFNKIGLSGELAVFNNVNLNVATSSQWNLSELSVASSNTTHRENDGLVSDCDFEDIDIDSIDASFLIDPISMTSNMNVPDVTLTMNHRKYDNKNAFKNGLPAVEDDGIECKIVDIKRNRGCDNSEMFVPTSDSGPKMYCCMYCKVRVQKLERHLRTVHKNEKGVQAYLVYPPRKFIV